MILFLFTVPEMNLMCMFDTSNRQTLLDELALAESDHSFILSHEDAEEFYGIDRVEETEIIFLLQSAIKKLNNLTDEEFSKIVFQSTNEDDEGDGGGVTDSE